MGTLNWSWRGQVGCWSRTATEWENQNLKSIWFLSSFSYSVLCDAILGKWDYRWKKLNFWRGSLLFCNTISAFHFSPFSSWTIQFALAIYLFDPQRGFCCLTRVRKVSTCIVVLQCGVLELERHKEKSV